MKNYSKVVLLAFVVLFTTACGGGKSELLTKEWNATEIKLGETTLAAADLGGISITFKADSTFSYTETGNTESGKWALNEKDNTISLTYSKRSVLQNIKEFTAEKLVLDYEEHGMKRNITFIPATK